MNNSFAKESPGICMIFTIRKDLHPQTSQRQPTTNSLKKVTGLDRLATG